MPLYGDLNSEGYWWDGHGWRTWGESTHHIVREKLFMDSSFNTHIHGCFTCPRCRRAHFLPDTFDYLCDGCQDVVLSMPDKVHKCVIDGILHWKQMAKEHWSGGWSVLIHIRQLERSVL